MAEGKTREVEVKFDGVTGGTGKSIGIFLSRKKSFFDE